MQSVPSKEVPSVQEGGKVVNKGDPYLATLAFEPEVQLVNPAVFDMSILW